MYFCLFVDHYVCFYVVAMFGLKESFWKLSVWKSSHSHVIQSCSTNQLMVTACFRSISLHELFTWWPHLLLHLHTPGHLTVCLSLSGTWFEAGWGLKLCSCSPSVQWTWIGNTAVELSCSSPTTESKSSLTSKFDSHGPYCFTISHFATPGQISITLQIRVSHNAVDEKHLHAPKFIISVKLLFKKKRTLRISWQYNEVTVHVWLQVVLVWTISTGNRL